MVRPLDPGPDGRKRPEYLLSRPRSAVAWARTGFPVLAQHVVAEARTATFWVLVLRGDVLTLVLAHHLGADVLADAHALHGDEGFLVPPLLLLHNPDELVSIHLREDELRVILHEHVALADGTHRCRAGAEAP